MRTLLSCLNLLILFSLNGQTFLADMPEPVSNNAVTGAYVNGVPHMFSFSGIDSTKRWDGIHKRAFRYNTETDVWETIAELPSGTGRIAAGASTVKNKIYIMGGYEVFANGNERTLDEVHIYNPETNEYEPNGKPMPVPVDDHVQVVYKDSLIICVTGWSQNTNVRNVQIYNPALDEWRSGTQVPNSSSFKVFGASGSILGDTLYYKGGARIGSTFPRAFDLKKGYINPNDPSDIVWQSADANWSHYRAACATINDVVKWFGGNSFTYNYDGLRYSNGEPSIPDGLTFVYNPMNGEFNSSNLFPRVMDLRGLAQFGEELYFCGGMESGPKVTNKTFKFTPIVNSSEELISNSYSIFPNPTSDIINIKTVGKFETELFDFYGKSITKNEYIDHGIIPVAHLISGLYVLKTTKNGYLTNSDIVIVK